MKLIFFHGQHKIQWGGEREKRERKERGCQWQTVIQNTTHTAPYGRGRRGALNAATEAGVIPLNDSRIVSNLFFKIIFKNGERMNRL